MHTIFIIYRGGRNNRNVDAFSRYPMGSVSDSDDGIIANEKQIVSVEEMFVKKLCYQQSTLSQQTREIDNKLETALESPDVGIEKMV